MMMYTNCSQGNYSPRVTGDALGGRPGLGGKDFVALGYDESDGSRSGKRKEASAIDCIQDVECCFPKIVSKGGSSTVAPAKQITNGRMRTPCRTGARVCGIS